ncbi:MAG: ABC transporter permease, partial [Lachnospiraceae bacterium]|nr:ABC transporter permease [Lachnospiraceae bacterium]
MFLENIRLALHSLGANKLRTFLTMLGIMIGVGAVVAIETIGAGQTKQMEEQFAGNGVNNIQIYMWSENYDEDAPQLSFTQDMMKKFVNKFGDHIEAIEMD